MTEKDKKLLYADLCARLPYGVFMTNVKLKETHYPLTAEDLKDAYYDEDWDDVPFLRSMSSMTNEEQTEFNRKFVYHLEDRIEPSDSVLCVIWLNEHHIDYNGLIKKGLALEAPENMYN